MENRGKFEYYVGGVESGEIVAGRLVRLAVRRHLQDLERAGDRGYYFSWPHACEAMDFFSEQLRHSKGEWAGKPFELTPNQAFIIGSIFGWRRSVDDCRRFNRSYVTAARKWGKTEVASGIALKVGVADLPNEPGAEVYLVATKEQQAQDLTFRQCCRMARQSPTLSGRLQEYKKALMTSQVDRLQPNSVIKPIGSDSKTSDGFDLHAAVLDELHAWQKRHEELYEKMTTAGGSRRQECIFIITTAGNTDSELWQRLDDYYVRVLESVETGQVVSDNHFAFIARIDERDDPFQHDPESEEFKRIMQKANPNYPVTPKHDYLVRQVNEARDNPLEQNKFLRFHANVRVDARARPIMPKVWREAQGELMRIGECHGAFDLGRSNDFAAWAICWMDAGKYELDTRTYTCEGRRKFLNSLQVQQWIRDGDLIEHPGDSVDFTKVEQDIVEASRRHGVLTWAYDPTFAQQMSQNLGRELGEDVPFKFTQTAYHYNEPLRRFLQGLKDGVITVTTNGCYAWQADNLRVRPNVNDEWMPDKSDPDYKIDAMVATLMAFSECLFSERESVWREDEIGF